MKHWVHKSESSSEPRQWERKVQNTDGGKDLRLSKARLKSKSRLWLLEEFVTKG